MKKQEILARLTMEDMKGLTNANLRQLLIQFRDEENMDIKGIWKMNKEELVENLNKIREQQTEEGVKEMNNNIEVKVEENMNLVRREELTGKNLERMNFVQKIANNMDKLPTMVKYTTMVNRVLGRKTVNLKELEAVCRVLAGAIQSMQEVVLTTKKQVHAKRKSILKNDRRTIISVEIFNAGKDDQEVLDYKISNVVSPLSRINREFPVEDSIVVPVSSKSTMLITKDSNAPFIKGLAKIHFKTTSFIELFKYEGIYVVFDRENSKAYFPSNKKNIVGEKLWFDPKNPRELKSANELMNLTKVNPITKEIEKLDVRHYDFLSFSPSDTRIGNGIMLDVTNGDNREEFLNSITGGAWTIEQQKIAEKVAKGADEKLLVLKTMPRFGQSHAGSVVIGQFKNWAMYTENFLTSYTVRITDKQAIDYYKNSDKVKFDENEDGSITLKINEATADGTGFILDEAFAKMLSKRLKVKVMPSAVRGLFIQARPLLFKGAFLIISRKMMTKMYKKHVAMKGKDGKSLVDNYGVIENDCPEFLVDDNIVKATSRFKEFADCLDLELLDIAKASGASISKQLIEKVLVKNEKAATAWLNNYMTKSIHEDYTARFVEKQVKVPTLGQIANPFPTDIIEGIAPTYAKQNGAIYKSMLENEVKASMKALDKMKYKVEGKNVRLISEHTELFTSAKSLIKYGEIFSPSANAFFAKAQREAVEVKAQAEELLAQGDEVKANELFRIAELMARKENYIATIKYPSMGIKEYYYAKALTLKDIKERVLALDVSKDDKEVIFDYFKSLDEGVTMLPARTEIMRQCAGLDFDYDGWTEIYDYDFVGLLASDEYFVVDCE